MSVRGDAVPMRKAMCFDGERKPSESAASHAPIHRNAACLVLLKAPGVSYKKVDGVPCRKRRRPWEKIAEDPRPTPNPDPSRGKQHRGSKADDYHIHIAHGLEMGALPV